jgi:hypothetical protein
LQTKLFSLGLYRLVWLSALLKHGLYYKKRPGPGCGLGLLDLDKR